MNIYKLSVIYLLAVTMMACSNNNEQNPLALQESVQKSISFIITANNEVLIISHSDVIEQDIIKAFYVLQTESTLGINLPLEPISGTVEQLEDRIIVRENKSGQEYVFCITDEPGYKDKQILVIGYGLSKHEGEFPAPMIFKMIDDSIYETIYRYNCQLLKKEPQFDELNKPNPQPIHDCGTSSCSVSWTVGIASYGCSVSCRDGYRAVCKADVGCNCEPCGSTGTVEGGGSSN